MMLDQLREEFCVRYYYWAMEDFKREISQGFPLLRGRTIGSARCVMQMMSEMTGDDQMFFAKSLVKRFHKEAIEATGDSITADEIVLCEEYHERLLAFGAARADLEREKMSTRSRRDYASRRTLRKSIETELTQLNMLTTEDGGFGWQSGSPACPWRIMTEVDTSNRYTQLAYHHDIQAASKLETWTLPYGGQMSRPVSLSRFISVNSWLGIGWGSAVIQNGLT